MGSNPDTALRWRSVLPLVRLTVALVALLASGVTQAIVLEGTGQAVIHGGDIDAAREAARRSALRDVALQYEARIASEETMENGVVTHSRLTVDSRAQARQVEVISEVRRGDVLRLTLRADMSASRQCDAGGAAHLKKRVAVTAFPVQHPDQARFGQLDDAGEALPQRLQARLRGQDRLQVLNASTLQLFGDLANAPTHQQFGNQLSNVVALAHELGAQFVVAGVIRDMGLSDPSAWGSSVFDGMQRAIGAVDQSRRFVVDLMVYDGFSGSPVFQKRFETRGEWNAGPGDVTGFASAGFEHTGYGRAVMGLLDDMTRSVNQALACQPFMTRITRVDDQKVTLDAGATVGLRPGDKLNLYRSLKHFDAPDATPELQDSKTTVRLDSVHPDFSAGLIDVPGGQLNIQRDDIAIVW